MHITVVGCGFVGRATGLGLTRQGHQVTFIDVNPERVASLQGEGHDAYLARDCRTVQGDMTMFCVPTPTVRGRIQLDYLHHAVGEFAMRLAATDDYHVAVVRSTVPPRTTREIVIPVIEQVTGRVAGRDFGVSMQPEYLREATAEQDFARPWFVTIGELDARSGDLVHEVYRGFDAPIERMTLEEAEFQKYVHNVYNAVKIAFFNELRVVAMHEGWDAARMFAATAESCEGIWNPIYGLRDLGPFDGSCLPKDTAALLQWGQERGHHLEILRAVIDENRRHEQVLGRNTTVRINALDPVHA